MCHAGCADWTRSLPRCSNDESRALSMNRTDFECATASKAAEDRRTAALQDAGALASVAETSARFWSAPPLRRFGFSRKIHGLYQSPAQSEFQIPMGCVKGICYSS